MKLKIVQAFYQEDQKQHLIPKAEHLFNETPSILLESDIMLKIFKKKVIKDCDWFGLISWKYEKKIEGNNLRQLLEQQNTQDIDNFDIISPSLENYSRNFYPEICKTPHKLLKLHAEVEEPMLLLLKRMKEQSLIKNIPEEVFNDMPQIYSNYWIAKKPIYIDYIQNFLKPALTIITKDKYLNSMICKSASYPHPLPEAFSKATKFNYYPIAPFLFERFINVYIFYKKHKINYCL